MFLQKSLFIFASKCYLLTIMEEKKKSTRGRPPGPGKEKGFSKKIENRGIENNLRLFITGRFNAAMKAWEAIEDPSDKFNCYMKVMEYVQPKKRSVEFTGEVETSSLEQRLAEQLSKAGK